MQTFFKVCPRELYDEKYGGKQVESPIAYTQLVNGSRVYWIHLDQASETDLRSLEVNTAVIDQGEEVAESTYIELDNRIGRWDQVEVPKDLLDANPNWPRNEFTGKPLAPAYHICIINPPDEGEFSYWFERYHPDSPEWQKHYSKTHAYFQVASYDNKALPKENLATLQTRDADWQERFVKGNFARGAGAIHTISPLSLLDVSAEWIKQNLLKKASLTRSLDHGASSPTACTWWATLNGLYYCYREYYVADAIISEHRKSIAELSGDEYYTRNLADPSIFRKESERYGGFWSVAQEYGDTRIEGAPIHWAPADNNEFATRNRINELLRVYDDVKHPITGELGAPKVYFCRQNSDNPNGCFHLIKEIASQKKKLLAEINGRKIYCDDREDSIADHAYDTFRYFSASHLTQSTEPERKPPCNSFKAMQARIKALKLIDEDY